MSTQFQDLAKRRSTLTDQGCWLWAGALSKGYAAVWMSGQTRYLTRLILDELGHDMRGQVCRHRCDVPRCVNPDHLEPGTQAQNMADAMLRGRTHAKISLHEAQDIRARYAGGGITQKILADEFGVTQSTISLIVLNRRRVPMKLTVLR